MSILLTIALALWLYMTAWYFVALIAKRNDLADIAWGLGFILVAWLSYYLSPGTPNILPNILVAIWGLRLALHIASRNLGKPEDVRYQAWRKEWGKWFVVRSYVQVFLLQGLLLFIVAIPVMYINLVSMQNTLAFIGTIVWIVGFIFESLADYELARFKADPANKGKILQTGVWNLSRHPNYFGEVSQWWGLYLWALPLGWWTILGPLTITYLIIGISGIPMLERRYAGNREYAAYQKRVSPFFPRSPK